MSVFSKFVTTVESDMQKAINWVKGVDWPAAVTYWQEFMSGLESALPVIEKLFPGSVTAVEGIVTPLLSDANAAVLALVSAVESYQAGTLTEGQVLVAAQNVGAAVKAAIDTVGAAVKGNVAVAAASNPA